MTTTASRRSFLQLSAGTAGMIALMSTSAKALADMCNRTPPQTPGPFYPGEDQFHADNDLTQIPGHASRALGQLAYVTGAVTDEQCRPIEGANVEIWQACASGRYHNSKDDNPAPLDPHFKYWGETFTDVNGEYVFKTIIPGAYPADTDWTRPPHIHFKVARLRFRDLVTQLYFKGNPLNEKDLILQKIPMSERANVVIDFQPAQGKFERGALVGRFNIAMQAV